MKNPQDLPSYLTNEEGQRAFLTFTTDVTGKWSAFYWQPIDEEVITRHGVPVTDETIDKAAQRLREVLIKEES